MYRTRGTPDDCMWPGVTSLPDYKDTFPKWPRQKLSSIIKSLNEIGQDLLEVSLLSYTMISSLFLQQMLTYEPGSRISALNAISHPYFDDVELPKCLRRYNV